MPQDTASQYYNYMYVHVCLIYTLQHGKVDVAMVKLRLHRPIDHVAVSSLKNDAYLVKYLIPNVNNT